MEAGEFVRSVAGDDSTFIIFEKTTKNESTIDNSWMFYIIYEMIPKVSKAKGDYRIEQTAHLIRMRGLFFMGNTYIGHV